MTIRVLFTGRVKPGKADLVRQELSDLEQIREVYTVRDGTFEILAIVQVPSLLEYKEFIEHVSKMKHLVDFESFIAVDS
jgi:DNA-binding Lrp family transcriptional regulator